MTTMQSNTDTPCTHNRLSGPPLSLMCLECGEDVMVLRANEYLARPQPSLEVQTDGLVERVIQYAREYEAAVRFGGKFVGNAEARLNDAVAHLKAANAALQRSNAEKDEALRRSRETTMQSNTDTSRSTRKAIRAEETPADLMDALAAADYSNLPSLEVQTDGLVEGPWSFDADERTITLEGAPIFQVFSADDFPCIEDDDRPAAEMDYLAHAGVTVLLLNCIATTKRDTTGEALSATLEALQRSNAELVARVTGALNLLLDGQIQAAKNAFREALSHSSETSK